MPTYTRKKRGGTYLLFALSLLVILANADTAPPTQQDQLQQQSTALPQGTELGSNSKANSESFLKLGKPSVSIENISPSHGPVSGDTRVLVRGGPFSQYKDAYPDPKCRFGNDDMIVSATYISCTKNAPKINEKEGDLHDTTTTCIQCENSPASLESKPVEFTVSLTGDFSDVASATQFYYYKRSHVTAIKPHLGPKDGGTTVHVWGENFVDFGEATSCSFGTRSVPAEVHAGNYITCKAPSSDVVQRGMPFSVSLNGQQQSKERIYYWYYNDPQVTVVEPAIGPETGGNEIMLRGDNFKPFNIAQGEVDNTNSTYCAFTELNVMVPAQVLNATRALCVAPPSYYWKQTGVELSLNAQDYTDDNTQYYYYKPPFLFDAQPAQGPVEGGTRVVVVGSNFNNTGNITCRFGRKEVPAKFVSSSEIACSSPPVSNPGFVDLEISLYPGLYSSPVQYLYYKNPIVDSIAPISGPESGFTQLTVKGDNFVDLGHNSALCVFNKTHYTNATVLSSTQIVCDTPSLLNKQGYSEFLESEAFYTVDVSIDGGLQSSKSSTKFTYYDEPKITEVSPANGPIAGGTVVTLKGKGFAQKAACDRVVRLGHMQIVPTSYTNTTMTFTAPQAGVANTAAVSLSLNGQQFTQQQAVHNPSKTLTYDYYQQPYASLFWPSRGPTNGGTLVKVQGYGFKLDRKHLQDKLWVRLVDANKQEIAPAIQVKPENLGVDNFSFETPAVKTAQDALLQVSLNKQDWVDVKEPSQETSFSFYPSPHVTSLNPSFGHVKATKDAIVEVTGSGFECFDDDCSELICRFGNHPSQYLYVKGELGDAGLVRCKVPEYTKPDVLKLEITINGESYTSDNHTYGFFDPFVLDAVPRLIATDGTTKVAVKGLGFVDSGEAKATFSNRTHSIVCGPGGSIQCIKAAQFQDKHTLITPTYPQSEVKYQEGGQNIKWDPIYIDATVIGDEFTENEVELFYYADPTLKGSNIIESPSNIQSQLLIPVDFGVNDMNRLDRYATPRCRFTYGTKEQFTEGQIITYPFTGKRDPKTANTIHCKTPRWVLDNEQPEKTTLQISLNGQNYVGNLEFTFLRDLKLHRDVPMSGPQRHQTTVKLIGQGYHLKGRDADLKWGTQSTAPIPPADIGDYTYNTDDFLESVPGSQELSAYKIEAQSFPRVDSPMTEGGAYDVVSEIAAVSDEEGSLGGPSYIQVGLDEAFDYSDGGADLNQWVLYNYEPSSVEYYAYKEPMVQKMHPTSGLTKGGTFVEVIGTWFRYMPEYGVVPHCRFGDKIVRAHFDSSVRLVCQSPANTNTSVRLPFEISLNGVDWSTTGFEYSYYEEPIMTDIYPDMGSVVGGDEIFIKGEKFTNHTDPEEFKCRFTPVSLQIPAKTIKARYINSTTIMCPSPGGWSEAARMVLQVTWNGVDYDENHFQYSFFSIHRAFPRSGPSNGKGGDIIVYGEGFREDTLPSCKLNNTQYDPISVNSTHIRCPMPAAEEGESYFGNVDFAVTANGISWNNFEGGFQYYEQPIVEDIDPKNGPASGMGVINFYGENFRADYPLAELGCKIGNAIGPAYFVSPRQVKCIVEDIPLLGEDDDPLPAQVSLNSYSFTELSDDTFYRPYGVLHIQPSSGPVGGVTTVIVQGQGFVEEDGVTPRCRFGTPGNFAIVEAEILSYTRLACRTPENLPLTPTAVLPRDVPFSIAISGDEFDPWTATIHKFRFYTQPVYDVATPAETDVGRMSEVYVSVADDSEFFDPMPLTPLQMTDDSGSSDETVARSAALSPIKCRFGRFGESSAVYLNSTTIKCTTPPINDAPDTIYRETVILSVSMNGQDFVEDTSELEFTFVGTAPYVSFATIVMTLLAVAFVGFAATLCTSAWGDLSQLRDSAPARFTGVSRGGRAGDLRHPNMQ